MAGEYWLPVVKTPIATENAAGRYDRDYEHMGTDIVPEGLLEGDPRYDGKLPYAGATDEESDDRQARQLLHQSDERVARLYVDRVSGASATGVDHPVKDVLFEAGTGNGDPTDEEIEDAYAADDSNDNLPAGMFGANLPIGR